MARATTALKATGDPPPEDVQTVPAEGAWHRPAPASETTPAPNSAAAASERVSLALAPAGRRERRIALAVVILSALAFIAAVPFARLPLPRVPAFIASYEAALAINDAITFVLLWGQFQESRSRAVLALACGYFFDALMMVPHALSFPGAFATTGLLGAGSQTTAWLYAFWHGGFPLFVIAYTRLRGRAANGGVAGWSVALGLLGVAGGVCALTVLTTAGQALLPTVIDGIHYAPAAKFVLAAVWAVSLVALVVLWRRKPHSIIDLWLMVVMCAWLFDIALSAVLNSGRFDLGFYAGRLYGLMAASFVLAALLFETNGLHRRLAKATAQLEGQARNLAASVRERTIELQQSNESLKSEIAERQRAEAQLVQAQKMEAIGNLTGGMAHDFNNLLGIIIGNLDTLRERKSVDCDVKELGGEALDAAIRGADLTRRLLAFARRQPLQPQRIALDELIAGNAKLLRRTLGEHIEISLEAAADLWPVIADPAQLEASLTNLATNARDAMPKGGRLMIATANRRLDADYAAAHAEVTPGDYAMIEVSDTGSGMTKEVLSRIFEPFYTTKERDKGTGLGLSMVFGFMKQSGGHINVYSEVGVGTTFRLY
ncbi:MAG TPA: MASE4 domain-containing protein, partial [Stellaceae bacterium]|nr:MASE4 domain-containing protein [Stellaceae bacterium]